jgi:hypothetical protein
MSNAYRTSEPRTDRPVTGIPAQGQARDTRFNPSVHDIHWREAYSREPYYRSEYNYDDYAPAYRTGYESAGRYLGQKKRFDDLDSEMRAQFERIKGRSRLAWEDAKAAAKAAWHRVERMMPGDSDDDGR